MVPEHTLARPVAATGVGLHSGLPVRAEMGPAPPGVGIRFVRADLPGRPWVQARVDAVVDSHLATVLRRGSCRVGVVEHLLAALRAEGVDNARIRVWGPEVPVLDGSARPWVHLIHDAGLKAQDRPRRRLVVRAEVAVEDGPRRARLLPSNALVLRATIRYPHPRIGTQVGGYVVENGTFLAELAWARTFGFLHEVEGLRACGLIAGGSLENALVYGPEGVVNPEGCRAPDEPLRHKLLDMLGDLALVGLPVLGRFEAELPGHALHAALVRRLLATPEAWEIAEG